MTTRAGVWMIFIILSLVLYAGPKGRHRTPIQSLPRSSMRRWTNACAQGWTSPGFRSAAILRSYLGETLFHTPERSGLPSDERGAGAERFGLPSFVRGIPGVL